MQTIQSIRANKGIQAKGGAEMERVTSDDQKMRQHRIVLLFILVFFISIMAENAIAEDDIIVSGKKLSWTSRLPSGWVGGNSKQIERVYSKTTNEPLRELMREMLLDAQVLDVFFTHIDVTGITTRTLSTIRVNTISKTYQLDDSSKRKAFWNALADLQVDGPGIGPGAVSTLVEDRVASTGGNRAYEATFKITYPNGGALFKIVHLVEIQNKMSHIFELKADQRKIRARREDFNRLLRSIRYN